MGCEVACGDCSNDCSDRLVDIEDYEAELKNLRARTKELEETMAKIKLDNDEATKHKPQTKLRSSDWFNRKGDVGMTALYVERYLNSGFTREELMSNKPIIGIAQSGSDIAPVSLIICFPFVRSSGEPRDQQDAPSKRYEYKTKKQKLTPSSCLSPSAIVIISSWQSGSAMAFAQQVEFPLSSPCTPSKRALDDPRPCWTETWPISDWSSSCIPIPSTASFSSLDATRPPQPA